MTKGKILKFGGSVLAVAALAFLGVQRFIAIGNMDAAFEQEVMGNISNVVLYSGWFLFFALAAVGCYWSLDKTYSKLVKNPNALKKVSLMVFWFLMWCGLLTVVSSLFLWWL